MTSNIGTRQLKEFGKGIGFAAQVRTDDKEYSRSVITKALNKSFAPEFINRLDEIITFDQLDLDALTRIIDIELKGLYSRVKTLVTSLLLTKMPKVCSHQRLRCTVWSTPIETCHPKQLGGWHLRADTWIRNGSW